MKKLALFLAGWVLAGILGVCSPGWGLEKGRVITPGDFFPEFSFPMTLNKAEIEYLGLSRKFFGLIKRESFSLKEVTGDLIVLEYMNKYCFSCQLQAPSMNQVFSIIENDPALKGKVKFIAIAAGNNQQEANSFREEKKVPFPIVPDSKFLAYEAIGDPGATPITLTLRKTDSGLLVARMKIGLTRHPEAILKLINESLQADIAALLQQYKAPGYQQAKAKKLRLPYSEETLLKKARESMAGPKWKVLNVAKVKLPDEEEIYVGEIQAGQQKSFLFSKLVSRAPTCDVCHATHFFYVFNEKGMITNFFPLKATKGDNFPWSGQDVEKMRKRLVGRSILQPEDFDARVDSISTATMTAAVIVDSVNKAKNIYDGLKAKGYLNQKNAKGKGDL